MRVKQPSSFPYHPSHLTHNRLSIGQHAKALFAFLAITSNLIFWCLPLSVLYVAERLLPKNRQLIENLNVGVYRLAVVIDDWVLNQISNVSWDELELNLQGQSNYLILSNHCSWSDIFILQNLVVQRGPIIKFLCKSQLRYIPIFGLIIAAFKFPVVHRQAKSNQSEADRRDQDLRNIEKACLPLREHPAAMLIFPEGTRATPEKLAKSDSSFEMLLPPKHKGFSTLAQGLAFAEPDILDFTLLYSRRCSFWQFLGGIVKHIDVTCDQMPYAEIKQKGTFKLLDEIWRNKDQRISAFQRSAY